jgi:hypothetical protein
MKNLATLLVFIFPFLSFGQSIFSNSINGVNPNLQNPYKIGQIFDPTISVSGIARGTSLFGIDANNRYDAKSWGLATFDPNAYFEFIITPNSGKKIDFISFVYAGQISANGPTLFSFRSSVDNFTSDIGVVTATGATVSLLATAFQNSTSAIIFRIYGWGAPAGTGTFSINNFKFNGVVSCSKPQEVVLPTISLSCKATSFDLNWPASLLANNYFIDVAKDIGFVNFLSGYKDKALGKVLSKTISGLSAGSTYYVRIRTENSCGVSVNSNTIEVGPPITVYNNGWTNGFPDINKNVQFSSDFNVTDLFEACSCQINNDVKVQVLSEAVLKLENGLDVEGTGSLIFEDGSSLVQSNDINTNAGKITYNRSAPGLKDYDYVYWSSPVSGGTVTEVLQGCDKSYSYASGKWVTAGMSPGEGFIVRYKSNPIQKAVFIGPPNNADISIAAQATGSSLIGNPYPSAIDADLFIAQNSANISSALYFWKHGLGRQLNPNGTQYDYKYDYATLNSSGGVGVGGTIPSGQAFFVEGTGSFKFTNAMRIGVAGSNGNFLKQASTKKATKIEKNRVWLNLTNDTGEFRQLLVAYITGATNDFDKLYDGTSMNGGASVDFYSFSNSKNLTIQGRGLPFDTTDQVPLGYKSTVSDTFAIGIDKVDGGLVGQSIYIEDKTTNTVFDLTKGSYSFTTEIGTFNDRFVLRYTYSAKLGTEDFDAKGKGVIVSVRNRQIKINSFDQNLTSVKLYDLKGSLVYEKNKLNSKEYSIDTLASSTQFLVVKMRLGDGTWVSEKMIFQD